MRQPANRPFALLEITQRFRPADQRTIDRYVDKDLIRSLTFSGRYEEAIAVLTSPRFASPGGAH